MRGTDSPFRAYRLRMPCHLDNAPKIQMKSGEIITLRPWDRIYGEQDYNHRVRIFGVNEGDCERNEYCDEELLENLGSNPRELYTIFGSPTPKEDNLYWYTGKELVVVKKESLTPFLLERGNLVEAKLCVNYCAARVLRINNEAVFGNLEIDRQFLEKFDVKHPYILA